MRPALATAVLLVAAALFVVTAEPAFAATFNVTTAADEHLTSPTGTTCVSSSGCSLRAAIEATNNLGGTSAVNVPHRNGRQHRHPGRQRRLPAHL